MKQGATPFGAAPKGYVAGAGRGAGGPAGEEEGPTGYDPFGGYKDRLFHEKSPYDDDDEEADKIYEAIDERMNAKRKRAEEDEVSADARQRIGLQFRELKEKLADVTEDEWASIPDVGDYRWANHKLSISASWFS
jgi:pre-mRNA-processing factor 6